MELFEPSGNLPPHRPGFLEQLTQFMETSHSILKWMSGSVWYVIIGIISLLILYTVPLPHIGARVA